MARAVWSGVISFGLVSVPVGLFTATEEHEPSFHQFASGTNRIRYKRVNERTGKEVDYGDIVKGVDVGGGKYVMVTDEELDQVAPGRSRTLDIAGFVDLDDIDPIYFNKTYYLAPAGDESEKTYALLRDAMADANRAGDRHLGHARQAAPGRHPRRGTRWCWRRCTSPTRSATRRRTLDNLPGKTSFGRGELDMANQLITSMAEPWKPERYHDTYTDRVNDLIEAKRRGHEVQQADEAPEATNVIDLFEALRQSVDSAAKPHRTTRKASKTGQGRASSRRAKKKPAKKRTAKATAKRAPAKNAVAKKTTTKKATASTKRSARKAS